ncbi:hypothetical protein [Asanoa siamensis]|uniref:Uncharacterized protein n=1 Tax=Asanoa siamensis TaxID=926357 RepID=A0ABQ4D519_9ACTN|nr:hypothetical protein [Asanoa siamensis]GIF78628.1 hypothetical protein Asi02nite_81460 [Asanoa siamensis]
MMDGPGAVLLAGLLVLLVAVAVAVVAARRRAARAADPRLAGRAALRGMNRDHRRLRKDNLRGEGGGGIFDAGGGSPGGGAD